MRRSLASLLLSFLVASSLTASTLPQLLQKAKTQFRLGAYVQSLSTLDTLEQESLKEGHENDRAKLTPVLAFYRAASYASLGRGPQAREQFEIFLAFQPDVDLDPAVYSKKIVSALDETRRGLRARGQEPAPRGGNTLVLAYNSFRRPAVQSEENLGEDWAEGPVRFMLTADERRGYARLLDPVTRSEFVTAFWKDRDPRPETAYNEFKDEFDRRVAFADSRFTQAETRGSMTDRGMVFLILGPPTYVGRRPLTSGEDANDSSALFRFRSADVRIASMPGGTRKDQVARVDRVTGPGNAMNDAASNWREVWHYRREHLPREVPYLQVDFDFVTKQGYGENVLQRETQVLDTLERAKAKLRERKA
ncbi:MAG: GWxTD domain-containing protein [Acidobacteriota bacterium]|nr:GWxTD domain-containing protein [Acidobacteriota bacterium]MDQ5872726.1 GWxTD domain-containing protein [Acidobacteriota bacterium]